MIVANVENHLGKRVALARFLSGKTLRELATEVGMSPASLNKWEQGKAVPNTKKLANVAKALGWPLSAFISENMQIIAE